MGSLPVSKLPIIELHEQNINPGSNSWISTSDSVRRAMESYGCFVVKYEKSSHQLHNVAFGLTGELFSLPKDTKMKYTSELPGFGYGGNYSIMPLFEYFGIEDDDKFDAVKQFASMMMPDGHDQFCGTIHLYCTQLLELDHIIMRMVASSYGLEKYCNPLIESSFYMSRFMKYHSPAQNKSNQIGIVPHRDKGFLAVIGTNEVEGLQIETPNGDWISFEPSPSKFIVIAGEAFMAWSNGRIYCPLHKVTITSGIKEKYSIGLFSFIRGILNVPKELVDDENPLKFKPFSNLDFIEYCKEGGLKMKGAIQTYCGIN